MASPHASAPDGGCAVSCDGRLRRKRRRSVAKQTTKRERKGNGLSSENERKRKDASQPSRLHGVLRGGMAFTLASTLMLPTTALADEPSIGSGTPRSEQNVVDELLKAEQAQTASTDATSDGVAEAAGEAFCAASEADAEAPDPNALIGSVAAGETDENSAGGGCC